MHTSSNKLYLRLDKFTFITADYNVMEQFLRTFNSLAGGRDTVNFATSLIFKNIKSFLDYTLSL